MQTDVLVVGAGPTGLMLANQLGRRGIRTIVIDRHGGAAQQSRAMAVHARTLEIYAKLAVASRAIALGRPGWAANMWTSGRPTARIPLQDIGKDLSPYPYVLMLGQDENERILGERLRAWNLAVQWNTELVSLEQRHDSVIANLKRADGSVEMLSAAYVCGCDGAHSAVRSLNGIAFPGAPYEHVFFVADTEAVGSMVPEELNVYLWRDGFHLFFPMRGADRWRVIGILPQALRSKPDLAFEDVAPAVRAEVGVDLRFERCHWFSSYRIHHRCAQRFRERRCFLLGDAAHIHSPVGGQGMNTGLQDAYNLAWKLALVHGGQASDRVLDTDAQERMPVARRLLRTTDRAFTLIVSTGWVAALIRTRVVARMAALAMRFETARRFAFRTVSQIGIAYRDSALSQTLPGVAKDAPRAGDRFPWLRLCFVPGSEPEDVFERLDDTRFNLVVCGEAAAKVPERLSGRVVRHVVSDDPRNTRALAARGIEAPAFFLVRPDGHIALSGRTFDAALVERYFAEQNIAPGSSAAQIAPRGSH